MHTLLIPRERERSVFLLLDSGLVLLPGLEDLANEFKEYPVKFESHT
jgi:hypothetical protein